MGPVRRVSSARRRPRRANASGASRTGWRRRCSSPRSTAAAPRWPRRNRERSSSNQKTCRRNSAATSTSAKWVARARLGARPECGQRRRRGRRHLGNGGCLPLRLHAVDRRRLRLVVHHYRGRRRAAVDQSRHHGARQRDAGRATSFVVRDLHERRRLSAAAHAERCVAAHLRVRERGRPRAGDGDAAEQRRGHGHAARHGRLAARRRIQDRQHADARHGGHQP